MPELKPAQRTAVEIALERGRRRYFSGCCDLDGFSHGLFWQVGTGKTPSAAIMAHEVRGLLNSSGDLRSQLPSLIVCPSGVRSQWKEELMKFTGALYFDVIDYHGSYKERQKWKKFVDEIGTKYVVMNYETAVIEQQWLQDKQWLALIADESHFISNPDAQRSRAVMSVDAEYTLTCTGTPITSRPDGLYNQLKRMDPGPEFYREWGKPAMPAKKRCPLMVAKARYKELEHVSWHRATEARRKIEEELHNRFGFVLGEWDAKYTHVPDQCHRCRWYSGMDEYIGNCKYGGNVAGKPPVTIRYRKSSPMWGSRRSFENRYCVYDFTRWGARVVGAKNQSELHSKLFDSGIATRVMRSEVADLDHPTYRYIGLDMPLKQKKLYDEVRDGVLERLNIVGEVAAFEIQNQLSIMLYLERVAAMTPRDFQAALNKNKPEWLEISHQTSSKGAKQEWLLNFLKGISPTDKVICFTRWVGVAKPLQKMLKEEGWHEPLLYIGEGMSQRDRDESKWYFNNSPSHQIIIVTEAGFQGINLQKGVREGCDLHEVFFDFGWNPEKIVQPIARALRVGFEGNLWIWFLRCIGTMDDYKVSMLQDKQSDIDLIIEGEETALTLDLFDRSSFSSKEQLLRLI
jgi:SNF2 family DNA or RNA helicase